MYNVTFVFIFQGHLHPELLHNEFTCLEFPRRVNKNDVGQAMLCRKPGRDGWFVVNKTYLATI